MIRQLAQFARPLLDIPAVRRTRRNHGLEHATITLLSRRVRGLRMAGRSSQHGFVLIGDAPTAEIERAAAEALRRMQGGERQLALHPNCGTNLLTTGMLTSLVGLFGFGGAVRRPSADRFAWIMLLMMLASLAAQPLGMRLQEHFTTSGDPGDLEIVSVVRREVRWPLASEPVVLHHVNTTRG